MRQPTWAQLSQRVKLRRRRAASWCPVSLGRDDLLAMPFFIVDRACAVAFVANVARVFGIDFAAPADGALVYRRFGVHFRPLLVLQ